ncbi:alpha/beta hydrolase-fold protein [Paenibacillus puerhi]|uniref:alpha/beta hydrolase-fold protein n=1 Tax=Paenibacillus puerhi TaxID=2692622 RepID=UPI0013578DD4|nr:alpha/beta hydrolase-fold protein [Paenibacillus puerhi]
MSKLPRRPDGSDWPLHGGAEEFIEFIESELKPLIQSEFFVDRSHQTLIGHSLGGLLVLDVLFSRTSAFQTYIAGSPST